MRGLTNGKRPGLLLFVFVSISIIICGTANAKDDKGTKRDLVETIWDRISNMQPWSEVDCVRMQMGTGCRDKFVGILAHGRGLRLSYPSGERLNIYLDQCIQYDPRDIPTEVVHYFQGHPESPFPIKLNWVIFDVDKSEKDDMKDVGVVWTAGKYIYMKVGHVPTILSRFVSVIVNATDIISSSSIHSSAKEIDRTLLHPFGNPWKQEGATWSVPLLSTMFANQEGISNNKRCFRVLIVPTFKIEENDFQTIENIARFQEYVFSATPDFKRDSALTITVLRRNRFSRTILNECDFMGGLENALQTRFGSSTADTNAFKIQVHDFSRDMAFEDQVKIMRATDLFISMHGAGMSNQLFMARHSEVIELFPHAWAMYMYKRMVPSQWRTYSSWQNENRENAYIVYKPHKSHCHKKYSNQTICPSRHCYECRRDHSGTVVDVSSFLPIFHAALDRLVGHHPSLDEGVPTHISSGVCEKYNLTNCKVLSNLTKANQAVRDIDRIITRF